MKIKPGLLTMLVLTGGLLLPAACRKAEDQPGPTPVYYGVKVDLPKLESEFAKANPELQASTGLVRQHFRYAQLPQALAELEKLAANPNLNASQKTVVDTLILQTKQVIANSSPAPAR